MIMIRAVTNVMENTQFQLLIVLSRIQKYIAYLFQESRQSFTTRTSVLMPLLMRGATLGGKHFILQMATLGGKLSILCQWVTLENEFEVFFVIFWVTSLEGNCLTFNITFSPSIVQHPLSIFSFQWNHRLYSRLPVDMGCHPSPEHRCSFELS